MTSDDTVKILELMASKICHDLISPVGAVSNGVEILEELGADAGDDVTSLIAFSANQANAKLKTLRIAYGLGGADETNKPSDIHAIFEEYLSGENRLSQDWDPYAELGIENRKGYGKILMCALILSAESLPKGGVVSVSAGNGEQTIITATGENAHFRDGIVATLNGETPVNALEPKLIHAHVTGLQCKTYGLRLRADESNDGKTTLSLELS